MPKKKHVPGEEMFNNAPMDEEPIPEPVLDEAEDVVPEPEVPSAEPVEAKAPTVDICINCGLPTKDFYKAFQGLRADLQGQNNRDKCPRCFKPVAPY